MLLAMEKYLQYDSNQLNQFEIIISITSLLLTYLRFRVKKGENRTKKNNKIKLKRGEIRQKQKNAFTSCTEGKRNLLSASGRILNIICIIVSNRQLECHGMHSN